MEPLTARGGYDAWDCGIGESANAEKAPKVRLCRIFMPLLRGGESMGGVERMRGAPPENMGLRRV